MRESRLRSVLAASLRERWESFDDRIWEESDPVLVDELIDQRNAIWSRLERLEGRELTAPGDMSVRG